MKKILLIIAALSFSACDTVYQSQKVVARASSDVKVRVLPITSQSVLLANRSSYVPKQLPRAFSVTAGTGGGFRGSGPVPEPAHLAQTRPNQLETRLPPHLEPAPYQIGIGDVVLLATPSGSSVEELSGLLAAQNSRQGYTVQDDGTIAIPSVGRVAIAGMTIESAEDVLFQRLVEAQIEPTFSLEISEFNSKRVSVGGSVNTPGLLPITLTPLYLDEALSRSGGLSASGDYVSVRLYRDGTLYQIPLKSLYNGSSLKRVLLQPSDAIFVDETYELEQAQAYFEQQISLASFRQNARIAELSQLQSEVSLRRAALEEARSNFRSQTEFGAAQPDFVYVTGEVGKQSRFPLPYGNTASLADALFAGGNGTVVGKSDPRHIYVLRSSSDPAEFGAMTAWQLNAKNAVSLPLATQFELRPNDVIFVAEQPVTRWQRTISQITPSIVSIGASAVGSN